MGKKETDQRHWEKGIAKEYAWNRIIAIAEKSRIRRLIMNEKVRENYFVGEKVLKNLTFSFNIYTEPLLLTRLEHYEKRH